MSTPMFRGTSMVMSTLELHSTIVCKLNTSITNTHISITPKSTNYIKHTIAQLCVASYEQFKQRRQETRAGLGGAYFLLGGHVSCHGDKNGCYS